MRRTWKQGKDRMESNEKRFVDILGWVLILGVVACLVWLLATQPASARTAFSAKSASREVGRLEARLSEARYVESTTRTFSDRYGGSVGRWVWLARDSGWTKDCLPTLCYVIYRESRGNPSARNSSSGAAGLLQFMPQWYTGGWSLPAFDPYDPTENLKMGWRLYKQQGWTPWAL
jgi:hypothetical protein